MFMFRLLHGRIIRSVYNDYYSKVAQSRNELLQHYYRQLELPFNASQSEIKDSFIRLAKIYHPDSGTPQACCEKFKATEEAFRELSKDKNDSERDLDDVIHDIKHTAPQHRRFLTYNEVGQGTPLQREKSWSQIRAQKAAQHALDHKISQSILSENTLVSVPAKPLQKVFGMENVEETILEAISEGKFDNLKGSGEPLRPRDTNPFVDHSTLKINEYLINNGFKPAWVSLYKEIHEQVSKLKQDFAKERRRIGPLPLCIEDKNTWDRVCTEYSRKVKEINNNILSYNLVVPILNKQLPSISFEKISDNILNNSPSSNQKVELPRNMIKTKSDYFVLNTFNFLFDKLLKIKSLCSKFASWWKHIWRSTHSDK